MSSWVRLRLPGQSSSLVFLVVECTDLHPVVSDFCKVYSSVQVLGPHPPETMHYTVPPQEVDEFTHVLDIFPALFRQRKYWYATVAQHAYLWGNFWSTR